MNRSDEGYDPRKDEICPVCKDEGYIICCECECDLNIVCDACDNNGWVPCPECTY